MKLKRKLVSEYIEKQVVDSKLDRIRRENAFLTGFDKAVEIISKKVLDTNLPAGFEKLQEFVRNLGNIDVSK